MCKFGFNFLQLYFSLPRVQGKVEMYRGKVEDITNIFLKI